MKTDEQRVAIAKLLGWKSIRQDKNQPERTMNKAPTPRTDEFFPAWDYYNDPFDAINHAEMLERELTAVTEQRDVAIKCHEWCYEDRKRIIEELTAVTEQRDKLAEALESIVGESAYEGLPELKQLAIEEALQSLTTNNDR
jgi:hypothetical protein